jgi:prevent-host-death family protein
MRVMSSRDFNQDVSEAKRIARTEPVIVTDRGRPTHVLMSIEAFERMKGQPETIVDLVSASDGSDPFGTEDLIGVWNPR